MDKRLFFTSKEESVSRLRDKFKTCPYIVFPFGSRLSVSCSLVSVCPALKTANDKEKIVLSVRI